VVLEKVVFEMQPPGVMQPSEVGAARIRLIAAFQYWVGIDLQLLLAGIVTEDPDGTLLRILEEEEAKSQCRIGWSVRLARRSKSLLDQRWPGVGRCW
jgi:hypothetical protein